MRTRRLILPFFSIPVTEAWPISPVRATCVERQDHKKSNDVIWLLESVISQSTIRSTIRLRLMAYQGERWRSRHINVTPAGRASQIGIWEADGKQVLPTPCGPLACQSLGAKSRPPFTFREGNNSLQCTHAS
jgi:hypothetical protein